MYIASIPWLVQSCARCVPADDHGQRGKLTLLNDARRDIILLVMMLLSILLVIVMCSKIVFQFNNKDLLLLFWYLTSLVSRTARQSKLAFCFSNFTELKCFYISDIDRYLLHFEMITTARYGNHVRQISHRLPEMSVVKCKVENLRP